MKASNQTFGLLRVALIAVLATIIIAACSPSTPAPTSTPTAEVVETSVAETESPDLSLPQVGPEVPTATPIVIMLDNAITTDSGLQYLEETAGKGDVPKTGELITMSYIASLPDGTELFNSYTQGETITTVWGDNRLLPGWEEGLGLMNEGAKAKLVLPPSLAFGEQGGGAIPPNSQIILEVELLEIQPAPVPAEVEADEMIETESGLQYYDLSVGEGAEAVMNSAVSTGFTIWVKNDDGYNYIDSSEYNEVVDFVIGRMDTVFPGWDEGVKGMNVGGRRLLVIPPALGMGAQQGSVIPPNSTLVMEVELLEATEPRTATEVDEDDYTTTDSGLKYYDLKPGTGATPETGQTVVVHYTGWLENGLQFDSSVDRGQPLSFAIGTGFVIPGWDEGVATMKVGGKRQLVVPPELGYGDNGAGGLIPPGATLIFEVELLEITDGP